MQKQQHDEKSKVKAKVKAMVDRLLALGLSASANAKGVIRLGKHQPYMHPSQPGRKPTGAAARRRAAVKRRNIAARKAK